MKKFATLILAALALVALPAHAQNIYVGVGPTFPNGDYADYAKTGFMLMGGAGFEVANNVDIWGEFFWGQNSHEDDQGGGKTNPYGVLAGGLLGFGAEDAAVDPYVFGGLGWLIHKYTPADGSQDSDSSDGGLAFAGGAGLGFALGGLDAFAEGRYMYANIEYDGGVKSATAFIALVLGVSFNVGGS